MAIFTSQGFSVYSVPMNITWLVYRDKRGPTALGLRKCKPRRRMLIQDPCILFVSIIMKKKELNASNSYIFIKISTIAVVKSTNNPCMQNVCIYCTTGNRSLGFFLYINGGYASVRIAGVYIISVAISLLNKRSLFFTYIIDIMFHVYMCIYHTMNYANFI